MLLPGKSDIIAAHYAGRAFFTHLLKSGVEIYNYQGEILHAKTAIFDCNWSVVGSANLDFQSLRRNDEGNVGILDRNFADQMVEVFSEDLKQSEQIKLEVVETEAFVGEDQGKLFCDIQDEVVKIFDNIKFPSKVKESHEGDIFDLSKIVSPVIDFLTVDSLEYTCQFMHRSNSLMQPHCFAFQTSSGVG